MRSESYVDDEGVLRACRCSIVLIVDVADNGNGLISDSKTVELQIK